MSKLVQTIIKKEIRDIDIWLEDFLVPEIKKYKEEISKSMKFLAEQEEKYKNAMEHKCELEQFLNNMDKKDI